jgi:exonuclease SbcC
MILKALEMENIRSYVNQTVIFPLGTTLFEGDVGSGKSTILNAIEFALFGLGSQRGGSLLRLGSKKGSVTLTFEVDRQKYTVHRSLIRRRKHVRQGDDGYIETEDGRLALSATELKERVLEILNFNEPPDPKAQSVIYRYAVFTPQEEMKVILAQNSERRLQTLRKAFGIEDYKIANENAQNTTRTLRQRSNFLNGQIVDLALKEKQRKQTLDEIRKYEVDSKALEKKAEQQNQQQVNVKKQLESLLETRREIERIEAEIPHYRREITDKTKRVAALQQENRELHKKIQVNQQRENDLVKLQCPTSKSLDNIKKELENARKDDRKIRREEAHLEVKINDYKSIEANKVCPTCDRPVDPNEFKQRIAEKNCTKKALREQIQAQEKLIGNLEELQTKINEYKLAIRELERLRRQVEEWKSYLDTNKHEIQQLTEDMKKTQNKLNSALNTTTELETVSNTYNDLQKKREQIENELRSIRKNINTNTGRITALEDTVNRIRKEITKKKAQKVKRDKLSNHQIWLSDYFIPTLDVIERQVMLSINQEFNQQIQYWFSMLIEDADLEVNVDEDFTPIILREGYNQDLVALSGGEKTSVALAYRLALNTIVQKVSTGIKSNLLILDEPTDGFSKEQLFKVRDIVAELRCPQIIMVSHERELESFADQIFQIRKTGGISRIGSHNS